jgi:hypothetical protein
MDWRFDLAAIECTRAGLIKRFEHFEDILRDDASPPSSR